MENLIRDYLEPLHLPLSTTQAFYISLRSHYTTSTSHYPYVELNIFIAFQ